MLEVSVPEEAVSEVPESVLLRVVDPRLSRALPAELPVPLSSELEPESEGARGARMSAYATGDRQAAAASASAAVPRVTFPGFGRHRNRPLH